MKKISFAILLALPLLLVAQKKSKKGAATPSGFIQISGLDLVKQNGEKFFIRGTNLGNWLNPEGYLNLLPKSTSGYRQIDEALKELVGEVYVDSFWRAFQKNFITRDDIRYIAGIGMNTVRIPFHYRMLTNEPYQGWASKAHGYAVLDSVVSWCRQEGIYAILDMHCAPGGQTGDNIDDSYGYPFLLTEEKNKQEFCAIWKELAQRFQNNPTVLAYDVINEPVAAAFFKEDTAMLNRELEAIFKRVIKSIRTVDKNHIVMVSGSHWGYDYSIFKDWNYDDKLMFTCHRYHYDTADVNLGIPNFTQYREKFDRPFYMGETGHEPNEWIAGAVRQLERMNIGWTFWPYKKMGMALPQAFDTSAATKAVMRSRTTMMVIEKPEGWKMIQDFAEADRSTYEAVRKNRPDMEKAKAVLNRFLEAIKRSNCSPNQGYIQALGLKP